MSLSYPLTLIMVPRMGDHELVMGSDDLVELRDSSDLLEAENREGLHRRLDEDGYLLLRGFHSMDLVDRARDDVLDRLDAEDALDPDHEREAAVISEDASYVNYGGSGCAYKESMPDLTELTDGEEVMDFFDWFIGDTAFGYDHTWGRAVPTDGFTGFHYDRPYMGRGTEELYTMWRPLVDVPLERGSLLLHLGSHELDRLRETYGQVDVDADNIKGIFTQDPFDLLENFGGVMGTTSFNAGDALIFGPYNMHGSLSNQTDQYRLSVDTRYQSLRKPADPRWVGCPAPGPDSEGEKTPIAEMRTQWGL